MKSSTLAFVLFFTTASATIPSFGATADHLANSGFASLRAEAARIGKPEWRDVLQYAVTDASVHDSQKLAELGTTEDGEVYADSAYRSAEAEAMLAQKQGTSQIHERAYRNRPLTEEQKESNRQKSKLRARIEHVFGKQQRCHSGCAQAKRTAVVSKWTSWGRRTRDLCAFHWMTKA